MMTTAAPGTGPLKDLSGPITDPSAKPGRIALDRQDWPALQKFCQKRLRANPRDHFGHRYLGLSLTAQKLTDKAQDAFEQALLVYPTDPVVLVTFAQVLLSRLQVDRAYSLSKIATEVLPNQPTGWVLLTTACYHTGKFQEGISAARMGLNIPMSISERAALLNNLSINLRDLGRMDEALIACREAIQLAPDWTGPFENLLLFLLSIPDVTAQDLKAAAQLYADKFETPWIPNWPRFGDRDTDPHRRLRIAFISPDFNQHSVMYFLEGLLPQIDRDQFEVLALYLKPREDSVTTRVRRHVDEFIGLAGLEPATLAKRLIALNIDILIDMAGHTDGNGLAAMARKPSPVQVTWMGYPGTTGLSAIDWRITDEICDQIGADSDYSEKLWRMPNVPPYRPLSRNPLSRYQPAYQVRPAPALDNGYITFGSCNNLTKLTDRVLITWARILQAVPGSRLLVEGKGLEPGDSRENFKARCAAAGIQTEQLEMIRQDSSQQYLTYHKIDIALDCFPLSGGTTTVDLLWMGVPLVSMNGNGFRSRMGVAFLSGLGHPEWVGIDEDDYVRIATALAQDVNALNERRLTQRRKMEASSLMDEAGTAWHLARALRSMWHHFCAKQKFGADTASAQKAMATWSLYPRQKPKPQVTIGTKQIISLSEAHQHLQELTEQALLAAPREIVLGPNNSIPQQLHPSWLEVQQWSEYLLDAIPNEPLALATLAEIEHAHGNTEFAATYLKYAQLAIMRS
jgi:predicted O-linked N-acetylglucosamine transferase (SPINDLY family)